jgi:hypothetical protein
MSENTKIFVNGLLSKDVPDTAPEFILGKNSIKVNDLIQWLQENRHLADENGWINTITKRSQSTGKRYIEVDTWKREQPPKKVLTREEEILVMQANSHMGQDYPIPTQEMEEAHSNVIRDEDGNVIDMGDAF